MEEKLLTKHPDVNKKGVNISKKKYDVIREAIIECFKEKKELTFTALTKTVKEKLKDKFQGSVPWYTEVVKLDLEQKEVITRIPKTKPQLYRLVKTS